MLSPIQRTSSYQNSRPNFGAMTEELSEVLIGRSHHNYDFVRLLKLKTDANTNDTIDVVFVDKLGTNPPGAAIARRGQESHWFIHSFTPFGEKPLDIVTQLIDYAKKVAAAEHLDQSALIAQIRSIGRRT